MFSPQGFIYELIMSVLHVAFDQMNSEAPAIRNGDEVCVGHWG